MLFFHKIENMENSYIHQSAELLELTLNTNVIQVTNVAPAATLDQMQTLFSFLGEVDEIKMYPAEDCPLQPSSRICYVRYADKTSVGVAQHLTNTVFIDRALIVVPVADGIIPDETKAMAIASPSPNISGMVNSGQSQLMNQVVSGVGGSQVITTVDPHLTALGLPQYPPLPANMDPTKIEEIRRTVYVGNLDSTITAEGLLKFFNQIGEVKYVRMAGDETQPTRFAFVEFTEQASVANALQYNGVIFGGRPLKINHSNNAIVKPQAKSSEAAQREIEEAMKRVREAQSLITAAIEPVLISELAEKEKKKDKSRSRSRSRSRIRSLSRSRRRSRSRSHHRSRSSRRSRSRSHHRSPLHRSRSHTRRHSRSPGHHSRSKVHKSRSRSRDRHSKRSRSPHSRHHRSRSKSKDRASKKHTRSSRSRSKSPSKKKSSKSSKSDSKKEKDKDKDKDKSPKEDKKKEKEKETKETVKKEEPPPLPPPPPPPPPPQNEEIKQNNLTTELEVAKIIAGILEEETKKQNESKNIKTEKSEVNEAEPSKKEEEEKGKKRPRSRTPSKYSVSPTKSPKYRSSRSPSHQKSTRSPTRHKTSRSPSRHKSSRSPSRQKISRSPSHRKTSRSPSRHKTSHSPSRKKSSHSPSRQKSSRSPGRHHRSHSPSYNQKRKSHSPKRSYSKRSPARQKSRSPSYRSSRSPNQRHRRSSRSPKRWSRSPRRRSRSRSHSVRRESKHKKKREEGQSEEKDKESKKKKKEESSHKESKVIRDYDEEEKGFDSSPEEAVQRPPEPPELPQNEKQQDSLSPLKVETKNSDSEGTDHKPGDMDLDSD